MILRTVFPAVAASVALLCAQLAAQQALTNDSIIKMVQAALGEDVIIRLIQQQPGSYSTSPEELIKSAGISDKILAAMVPKSLGKTSEPTSAPSQNSNAEVSVRETGVYYKKDGEWVELLPEVVNWRTGGVFKTIATGLGQG